MKLPRKFNLQMPGPKSYAPSQKRTKLTAVRGFGRKAVYLEGHNFRLYVTVVAIKLLLGNFGYKAV
jgi:hypothetical protein